MSRRPWYGFLYYLLGASGSFFAWVVSILGVYVTYREALLRVANREPNPATVVEVFEEKLGLKRWVQLGGIEVDLGRIRGRAGLRDGTEDTVLMDADNPAAAAFRSLVADLGQRHGELPVLAGHVSRLEEELRKQHSQGPDPARVGKLEGELRERRYAQHAAYVEIAGLLRRLEEDRALSDKLVVVVPGGLEPSNSPAEEDLSEDSEVLEVVPPATPATGSLEWLSATWREAVEERLSGLTQAVRLDVVRTGLMTPLPGTTQELYELRYGVQIGRMALVVGHKPSDVAAWLFGGFSSVLCFLIAGLFALRTPSPS
ncbi:hypothetical protein ACFL59_04855 [Planctomycetota bacterium]